MLRLFYFFSGGGGGFLVPFMTLFYRSQNLSGTEIGWISTISAICAMLAAPVWMRLSGQGERRRRALQWMHLAGLITIVAVSQQHTFVWLAVLVGLFELAVVGIQPASDTMTVKILESTTKAGFGSVRVWASLGWAIMAVVGGVIIQRTSYLSGFLAYAGTLGLAVLILFGIRAERVDDGTLPEKTIEKRKNWKDSLASLRTPIFWGLALALVVQWATQIGVQTFEPVYLKHLGAPDTIIGVAGGMGATIELGGMFLADRLTRRKGAGRVVSYSFIIYALGVILVLVAPSVTTILIERAINGIAFSFFTVGVVNYINVNTKPGETATVMALITITLRSLVGIIASPLNGMAFDVLGPYWLYAIALGGYLMAFVVFQLTTKRQAHA
jgi:PPP family 3-phenylpropionic acid transporter